MANKKTQVEGLDRRLTDGIIRTLQEPLVVLDANLCVIFASQAFYDKFKIKNKDIQGRPFYEIDNNLWGNPALRTLLEQVIPDETDVKEYEVEHNFDEVGKRIMIINACGIRFENPKRTILISITDVTELRRAQQDREKLMMQKDILLKEMRHRIANSLQLIASIIILQAGSVKSEESRKDLEEAHDRILYIATVQRNLDPTSEGSLVPVNDYLTILCQSLTKSMIGGRNPIIIKVISGDGVVEPDTAISLGLMTTELVINSLKHAFPNGKGLITVTYASKGVDWKLCIGDDGVGISSSETNKIEGGLGTSIVESLANQLGAEVSRKSTKKGTLVSIFYPRKTPSVVPTLKIVINK